MSDRPLIKRGSTGDDVRYCQQRLTDHGYSTTVDGSFGGGTEGSVQQFQRAKSLTSDGVVGNNTWNALEAPVEDHDLEPPMPLPPALEHLKSLGYKIMWQGDYHMNYFGIRSPNKVANAFDDMMGCAYTVDGMWKVHYWPITTDPGTYYLEDETKWYGPEGVAILACGQYVDVYKIDEHGSSGYLALCQRNGSVTIYRDGDLDNVLDFDESTLKEGQWIGINLHASTSYPYSSGTDKDEVGAWSAGCQVHATVRGFREMMELAHLQVDELGLETFTYTLMDQWF
jgi:hypothetical protein